MERKLAAILEADMAADEVGTRARRKAYLSEVIAPRIAENGGGIVKTTGGGLLGAFSSVVDALRCAVGVQLAPVRSSLDTNA